MAELSHDRQETRLLPLYLQNLLVQKFVEDALVEAAVDQAAAEIHRLGILPLFARQFPDTVFTDEHATVCYASDGMACPEPEPHHSLDDVAAILRGFHVCMTTPEPRTGIRVADPSSPPGSLNIYASAIVDAALLNPPRPRRRHPRPIRDVFASSFIKSPVLTQLERLATPIESNKRQAKVPDLRALWSLREALHRAGSETVFTCGGAVDLKDIQDQLILRFDRPNRDVAKITLPVANLLADRYVAFNHLLVACEQATFGYQGRDVLDHEYRKALKLDPTNFSINFHPADHGILDAIADTMLKLRPSTFSIRAHLYKLNIYEATGKFKAHVDTPRSERQVASLVVCLPMPHSGGELAVRHNGKEVVYDWSQSTHKIQWAAFFSDCEHEVLEVHSGNRITLTYNLYVVPNDLNEDQSGFDLSAQPACQLIAKSIGNPGFLPDGGLIGFHCRHAYARHRDSSQVDMASCLKGLDRLIYLSLRNAVLKVGVAPCLTQGDVQEIYQGDIERHQDDVYDDAADTDEDEVTTTSRMLAWNDEFQRLLTKVEASPTRFEIHYSDEAAKDLSDFHTFEERLTHILTNRQISGLPIPWLRPDDTRVPDRIGLAFGSVQLHEGEFLEGELSSELFELWPAVHDINWLNGQHGRDTELAMAYMKYGNQAELEYHYASLAIIAEVPPYGTEKRPATDPEIVVID